MQKLKGEHLVCNDPTDVITIATEKHLGEFSVKLR